MNNSQSPIPNSQHIALSERQKYVRAFNTTMVKLWREKIALLGVVRTGALYRSTIGISMTADGKFLDISLSQAFNEYGIYVDRGSGRNTPRGGAVTSNNRRPRRWFSKKYYSSVMNIQEFYADNVGRDFCNIITSVLAGGRTTSAI